MDCRRIVAVIPRAAPLTAALRMPVVRAATMPVFRGRIAGAAPASASGICANQPCYIRNSTLLFPADTKNAPCSVSRESSLKLLKQLVNFTAKNRLSLQFLKISLQIADCREEPRETFSLLTAYSATQSSPPADCGVGQCRRRSLTIARAMVDRAPNPALAPMTPARPIAAVSTVAPFCMTATNSEKKPAPGAGGA
jgi:hypothetical protein